MRTFLFMCLFAHTVSMAQTQQRGILVACDSPVFDIGHVPYGSAQSNYSIDWKVKNISHNPVLCPTHIDVWNDCGTSDGHTRFEPLLPGKSRTVKIHVRFWPRSSRYTRGGTIHIRGGTLEKPIEQEIYVQVEGYFDEEEKK